MSVEAIANQPIQFDVIESSCNVQNLDYIQIVDTEDVSQIQFKIQPCLTAKNVIENGAFSSSDGWTTTDSFSIDTANNQACKASGGIGTLQRNNLFVTGKYYQLRIVLTEINEVMQVWNSGTQLGIVSGIGEYVFSFQAVGDSISIRSFSTTNEACISSISAYELDSRLILAIFDLDGTHQAQIKLADDPQCFVFADDTLTVSIDWNELGIGAGCYYIGIADPCINTNGQNGMSDPDMRDISLWDFTAMGNWNDVEVQAIAETGLIGFESQNSTDLNTMTWEDNFITTKDGLSYDYTITVYSNSVQTEFTVSIGGVSGVTHTVASMGAVETFTGTIVGGATGVIEVEIVSGNDTPVYTIGVSHFDISLTNNSDMDPDSQSVNLKIGTFDCSVLLNANNNENNLGFEFEDSRFNPRLRLEGELINPTYPTERVTLQNTLGDFDTVYGERLKARLLKIDLQPEYIMDFLSLLSIMDNLWIDGVKYHIQEDEVAPEYPEQIVSMGKLTINVIEQGQALVNRNSTGVQNGNAFNINGYIVDPFVSTTRIAEPATGDPLVAL